MKTKHVTDPLVEEEYWNTQADLLRDSKPAADLDALISAIEADREWDAFLAALEEVVA